MGAFIVFGVRVDFASMGGPRETKITKFHFAAVITFQALNLFVVLGVKVAEV